MSDIETIQIELLDLAVKHGKHNQASHGRKTARRRAYSAAYSSARAGGASPAEARAAAREAGMARQSERDTRLERLREASERQRFSREIDRRFQEQVEQQISGRDVSQEARGTLNTLMRRESDLRSGPLTDNVAKKLKSEAENSARLRDESLSNGNVRDAARYEISRRTYEEALTIGQRQKQEWEEGRQRSAERFDALSRAKRLQDRLDRGSKLTKTERQDLERLRDRFIQEERTSRSNRDVQGSATDDQLFRGAISILR
jgi:hypothetical protein